MRLSNERYFSDVWAFNGNINVYLLPQTGSAFRADSVALHICPVRTTWYNAVGYIGVHGKYSLARVIRTKYEKINFASPHRGTT